MTIQEVTNIYKQKIDYLDLEIIIAHSLGKTREFVLTHPEYEIPSIKIEKLKFKIARRAKGEPIAYILGHKEFYGLDFIVNKHTLVPRPETEQMVGLAIKMISNLNPPTSGQISNLHIADIGTGSGCIITSIAKKLEKNTRYKAQNTRYFAIDISKDALKIAKKNARVHNIDKKIKFLNGNLLSPLMETNKLTKLTTGKLVILANLPYLSKEIYHSAPIDVKKFEPKTALFSSEKGLKHYRLLLEQIREIKKANKKISIFSYLEISPEQKNLIIKIIKDILPSSNIEFKKDLARKWRLCIVQV